MDAPLPNDDSVAATDRGWRARWKATARSIRATRQAVSHVAQATVALVMLVAAVARAQDTPDGEFDATATALLADGLSEVQTSLDLVAYRGAHGAIACRRADRWADERSDESAARCRPLRGSEVDAVFDAIDPWAFATRPNRRARVRWPAPTSFRRAATFASEDARVPASIRHLLQREEVGAVVLTFRGTRFALLYDVDRSRGRLCISSSGGPSCGSIEGNRLLSVASAAPLVDDPDAFLLELGQDSPPLALTTTLHLVRLIHGSLASSHIRLSSADGEGEDDEMGRGYVVDYEATLRRYSILGPGCLRVETIDHWAATHERRAQRWNPRAGRTLRPFESPRTYRVDRGAFIEADCAAAP